MSDNSFQAFYDELQLLVEKFEKKQTQIKMESDLDYDSVKMMQQNWHTPPQNIIHTGQFYTIVLKLQKQCLKNGMMRLPLNN